MTRQQRRMLLLLHGCNQGCTLDMLLHHKHDPSTIVELNAQGLVRVRDEEYAVPYLKTSRVRITDAGRRRLNMRGAR